MRMGLRYVDRFERRDGGPWLIATRICAFEWRYTLTLHHSFAYDDDFTIGYRDRSDITYTREGPDGRASGVNSGKISPVPQLGSTHGA